MADSRQTVRILPVERRDPPSLGEITITGRLQVTDAGIVYAGSRDGQPVAIVMLTEGAEQDSYGRARFAEAVGAFAADHGDAVVAADDDPEVAPWLAVKAVSWEAALRSSRLLLAPVTLEHVRHIGGPRGPGFRPHWLHRVGVGRWRLWPLPWPARLTAAGRWTYLVSFALVVLIAAIALWIAVKIFEGQPVTPPRPGPYPPGPTTPAPSGTPSPTPTTPTSPVPGDTGGLTTGPSPVPPIV